MRKQLGFTLTELMMTLVIAIILLSIATPSFIEFVKNNRLTTDINDLVSVLNLARSESITRGVRVNVCKSTDLTSCDTSDDGWEQGWIAFTDENGNADFDSAGTPPETLLRVHEALDDLITATGNTSVANYISYIATGQSQLVSGAFQAGTIKICDDRTGDHGKNLVISSSGKIRTETGVTCP